MGNFLNSDTFDEHKTSSARSAPLEIKLEEETLDDDRYQTALEFIGRTVVEHFWCPYCGGWHGAGFPPNMQGVESTPAPRVPEVLGKIVRKAAEVGVESTPGVRPETSHSRWQYGGFVDGQPAKVREDGKKVEALWGGVPKPSGEPWPDGPKHGHIVSHDGLNASLVAEPGAEGSERDTPVDDFRVNPYDQGSPLQYRYNEESGSYDFS